MYSNSTKNIMQKIYKINDVAKIRSGMVVTKTTNRMKVPRGATHYDFKKSCFYKVNEKFYKYNGFGWCEVKEVNLKNCIKV